jgi:tRNA-binding EMAP/Myf-like protein
MKPSKFAGVLSSGMVLCATSSDKTIIELLQPPENSKLGEAVTIEGYEFNPDPILNPKQKIWEKVAVDLKTDDECIAQFKGLSLMTSQGQVGCESLKQAPIS